jgi:tetratricopeptide (TPR) repeat protein
MNVRKSVKQFIQENNYESAKKCCMDIIETDPKEAYLGLGYIHYRIASSIKPSEREADAKKSEEYYLKVLEIDSQEINALSSLARLYEIINKIDLSTKYYEMALAINKDPIIRYNYELNSKNLRL